MQIGVLWFFVDYVSNKFLLESNLEFSVLVVNKTLWEIHVIIFRFYKLYLIYF